MSVLVDDITARIQLRLGALIVEAESLQQALSDTRRQLADAEAEVSRLQSLINAGGHPARTED